MVQSNGTYESSSDGHMHQFMAFGPVILAFLGSATKLIGVSIFSIYTSVWVQKLSIM